MTEIPLVSIIVPVYNMGRFLPRAIDSFLSQSLKDFEIIICDNNSTDGTDEIVKRYHDERIRYMKNDSNIGMIANFNKGLLAARGKYITLISCDEFMLGSDSLERRLALLENETGIDFVWCGYDFELLPEDGSQIVRFPMKWPAKDVMTAAEAIDTLYRDSYTTNFRLTTVVVRADILRAMNYTIPLVHSGDLYISLNWLIHSRMAACVRQTLHRSYMHLEHQHDFFGRRQPYVGERDYLNIKFLDERRTRLVAMGLPIATYEVLMLWRMFKLLPKMAGIDFSYFVHYSWFMVCRAVKILLQGVYAGVAVPAYMGLRWGSKVYHWTRSKLRRVDLVRRIYFRICRKWEKG
jgi:glycosyltransferase involved in cell wall biosynthesis